MVHANWYTPVVKPLTTEAGSCVLEKLTVEGPDTKDQVPVPELGVLPANTVVVLLQTDWSAPALAGVTNSKTVIVAAMPEYSGAPTPFCTNALNSVVIVRLL